jgi:hypothetical protein
MSLVHTLLNGSQLDLSQEDDENKQFFSQALQKFQENTKWLDFDEWAFGQKSPIYKGQRSHLDVLKKPTYIALKDLSTRLGKQQEKIK